MTSETNLQGQEPEGRFVARVLVYPRAEVLDPQGRAIEDALGRIGFDMIVRSWGQSLSPGNEQRSMWHSSQADEPGSRNFVGIRNPAVDELVELVITAPTRESLVARTRALDRVLLWNHYVIPQWHFNAFRVLYWDKFGMPETRPKYALGFDSWWIDEERETALNEGKTAPTEQ